MDLGRRFAGNPILGPKDLPPVTPGFEVACVLNPGVFEYQGKVWLLARVAERPAPEEGVVHAVMLDPDGENGVRVERFAKDAAGVDASDPRVIRKDGIMYLTTLSHLRLFMSAEGEKFLPADVPPIIGRGFLERFGIEDARVTALENWFAVAYTAVSAEGFGIGLMRTRDWRVFDRDGMILPPLNKDCAIFPEKINDEYWCVHRPSFPGAGLSSIWTARSPDLVSWGHHELLLQCRPGEWDGARVGAGGPPVRTESGWLLIYHGADAAGRYCLGACLLDLEKPDHLLGVTPQPIMEPTADYEKRGFFGNVVFSNGHIVRGDELILYYGASDEFVCGARFSIEQILSRIT